MYNVIYGGAVVIKGVNRQIIEITDVSSEYYERALLIVKPEFSYLNKSELEKEAKKVLGNVGLRYNKKRKYKFLNTTIKWIITVLTVFGTAGIIKIILNYF